MTQVKISTINNMVQILKNMHIFDKLNSNILGRWKLENNSKTFQKVDYANVDHCGTCSYGNFEFISSKK